MHISIWQICYLIEMGFISSWDRTNKPLAVSKRRLIWTTCLGLTCLVLPFVIILSDPLRLIARYRTRIANGSPIHEILKKEIEGVHLSVYLFNITNSERFLSGEDVKLKVQEIGPFTYKEMRTHEDLELDSEAGVMRYSPRIRPVFQPEESVADPEDVEVTLPNIAMLSMTSMMSTYPYISRMGYNFLALRTGSQPVVRMNAHDYLWGYPEPLITVGNTFMPGWINFEKMGLLDRLYDEKLQYRLEVSASDADKFSVKKLNGCSGLKVWNYDDPNKRTKCNTLVDAYEGIWYPTDLTPETPIRIFRNVLCRMLELDFHGKKTMDYGAEALIYKISNRTFMNNPDKDCVCGKELCVDGLSDLSPCFYDLPMAMSNAHFMGADPKLSERIEGLRPNEEDHGSHFLIEPKVGVVLKTSFSIQVNIIVKDVSYNRQARRFSDMVLPVGYFKIFQPELTEDRIAGLKFLYVTGPYILLGLEVLFFLTGLGMLAYAVQMLYWNWICSEGRGIVFQPPEDWKKSNLYAEVPLTNRDKC